MHIARLVAGTIARHALVEPGDRVALAVSGGSDSVALVWLLRELAPDLGVTLAGLIHVHHGLRGADADSDEAFVCALADRLDLRCDVSHVDVRQAARTRHRSIEATARELRYECFHAALGRLDATAVATGHTQDDQAETILLRLLRGTGGRGLAGVRVSRGPYIRPLLDCRRAELQRYLAARGEPYREDRSNLDRAIPRNGIRHELIPVIEHLAPSAVRAIARFAELAADDEAYLEAAAIEATRSHVLSLGAGVQVQQAHLAGLAPAVARRVIRRAVELVAPGAAFSARHLEAIRHLAAARADNWTGHLNVPGVSIERRGDAILIGPARQPDGAVRAFEFPLPVPGEVPVPAAGVTIEATEAGGETGASDLRGGPDVAVVQAASVALPLAVRSRRPGDRFRPLGAPGRRKVQDVFVDRKVPRSERDRVPIVVDALGRIVWLAGLTMAHECRVTAPEAGMVILKLRRLTTTA